MFDPDTIYFGKARKTHVDCPSHGQAELILRLANLGVSGKVSLPADNAPCFKLRKTLGLCGSEVPESGQFSCCDVYPQGLLDNCDRIEAALFERGEDAHEDGLG